MTAPSPVAATSLRTQVERCCRHLLSQQHRDPYGITRGCFDRRYWAWKLVDFPEATYQRAVGPLSWWLGQQPAGSTDHADLTAAVTAGLDYASAIQHADGSFDQAFPNEHSFGATAFMLADFIPALAAVRSRCPADVLARIERMCARAAEFLCRSREHHGYIANHLAGAALALESAARALNEPRFGRHSASMRDDLVARQSSEGWFGEYGGADPGYQTLCVSYLAQLHLVAPQGELAAALERAVGFLAWFAHPDGSFGGEYGSRRTAICYPAGLVLLAPGNPLAHALAAFMIRAANAGRTVTLDDVDQPNLVPLLGNYASALDRELPETSVPALPCERGDVRCDFREAGLHVRATSRYYAVVGASNGGVIRVFDRSDRELHRDGGYVGALRGGSLVTTQTTDLQRQGSVADDTLVVEAPFRQMRRPTLSPWLMVALRLLNLTVMKNGRIREAVKKRMARVLMTDRRPAALHLTRKIQFTNDTVEIDDTLTARGKVDLSWLACGQPFVGIHMASAGYYEGSHDRALPGHQADAAALSTRGTLRVSRTISAC